MGSAAVLCGSCGTSISGSDILYTAEGGIVCAICSDKASIRRDEQRAAGNIQKAAWSCLTLSVLGWFFDPLFSANALCIVSGLFALRSMMRGNERFTQYLGAGARTQVWVCTAIGLAITGIQLLIVLTALGTLATASHR